jgi:hypothetical protein
METEGAKKLRKSAANPLKSLAHVNLCPGGGMVRRNSAGRAAFRPSYRVTTTRAPTFARS